MLAPSRGSSADPLPCVPNPAPMGCQCDGESGQWVPQTLLPLSTTLSPAGHRFPFLVPCLWAPPGSLDTETTTLPCCPALARCFPTCPPGMDEEQRRVLCALLCPRHGVSPGLVPSWGRFVSSRTGSSCSFSGVHVGFTRHWLHEDIQVSD